MAENDESQESAESAGEAKGLLAGKSKKLMIILAAIAAVALSGGIYFAISGNGSNSGEGSEVISEETVEEGSADETKAESKKDQEKADNKDGDAKKDSEEESKYNSKKEIGFGETFKFKPFSLNLANLENHYIRVQISLEYSGGETHKNELIARTPQLRDAIISIIGSKTKEFLLAPDGKDALRKEILIRINRYMKTKIDSVYITDIIIE